MADDVNCCRCRNATTSTVICILTTIICITFFILAFVHPETIDVIVKVGGTLTKVTIAASIQSFIILVANVCLGYGIYTEWPVFMLIWLIINALMWKLAIIMIIFSIVYTSSGRTEESTMVSSIRLVSLCIVHISWAVMIVLVGQHWYALCEEVYLMEYGSRPGGRSMSHRFRTMSNRTRAPSAYSTRIPHVLNRIER